MLGYELFFVLSPNIVGWRYLSHFLGVCRATLLTDLKMSALDNVTAYLVYSVHVV